ncbi:MAG: MFS transporter [Candidatus Tectomicrobia bacterium]|nr:MFS transporter [Candidatus Tectomicrobia bacterium]
MTTENRWCLLAAAWCVAMNLRGVSIAVSPILPLIKGDLGLTYAEAGFLFGAPTILMALFGFPGGWLADTLGMKRTIALGLTVIVAGGALRVTAMGFASLSFWMALLGAGMGIAGPGLARMVKDRFSDIPGTATGIYTSGFIMGATAGSWLTVPYLLQWSGSWRGTFWVWSGFAFLTLLGWVVLAPSGGSRDGHSPRLAGVWRDRTVWKLNVIFLCQGLYFYSLSSWSPTYYRELGETLEMGTLFLTVFIFMNLPSSLLVPYLSDRFGGRRAILLVSTGILLLAMLGMVFFPLAAPWTYASVMGLAMGGIFALSFALPLDYVEPTKVGSAAGANLLVGYGGSFLGPLLMGLVHDLTGSFAAGWSVVVAVLLVLIGTAASLPKRPV